MDENELRDHIAGTYMWLRLGVALLGFIFPFVLWIGGAVRASIPLADSMSAYYHIAGPPPYGGSPSGAGIMRDEFVGILFGIGIMLIVYKGFHIIEDYVLNLAGIFAIGVAIFPMSWPPVGGGISLSGHGVCAVAFFVCIAYICVFHGSDTLCLVLDEKKREFYRRLYQCLGVAMVVFPAIAFLLTAILHRESAFVFFVEALGGWFFSGYWLAKTIELAGTNADRRAAHGELQIRPRERSGVLRSLPVTPIAGFYEKPR